MLGTILTHGGPMAFNKKKDYNRTEEMILRDYMEFLISKGSDMVPDEILTEPSKRAKLMAHLLQKCYDKKGGFFYFVTFIIGPDPSTDKKVWNRFVSKMIKIINQHDHVSLLSSRGMGKSFLFTILYPIYVCYLYEMIEILVVCNTGKQVKVNFNKLKYFIDTNEILDAKPKGDWNAEEINYNNGWIYTRSVGSNVRGIHANICIADDILRDDGKYPHEFYINYVQRALISTIEKKGGRFYLVGTPQSTDDVFHFFMMDNDNDIVDGGLSARGFYSEVVPIMQHDGTPMFPELRGREEIAGIRRRMDDISFNQEYLCICISDKTALFPSELLNTVFSNQYKYMHVGTAGKNYLVAADVATSGAASADFSAFMVLEVENDIKMVRHIVHVKGMPIAEQVDTLEQLSKDYNNCVVIVEKNNVGVALIQDLEKRGRYVEMFVTDKPKKEGAIRYLISEMKNGRVKIPENRHAGMELNPKIAALRTELQNFGVKKRRGKETMEAISGHDDLVDSLWLAVQASQKFLVGDAYAICQD